MPRGATDQIVGQLTDATIRLVDTNLNLLTRITGGGREHEETKGGPAEDVWMTWAESAGDLVTISYLAAQLLDTLGRTGEAPPPR